MRKVTGGENPKIAGVAQSQSCDILPWRFSVYAEQGGQSDVQQAIDRLSDRTSERFKAIVRHLAAEPRDGWHRPQAAKLTGFQDLFELRFNDGNTPCRPTGFFGPTPGSFTLTLFVTKNRNGCDPPNAFNTANARRRAIVSGQADAVPLKVHGEDFPPLPDSE